MSSMPAMQHPNLIVGTQVPDDAAVYKLNDEVALIQTVDFFPPIVDDPYRFGQIAAANALSDIYAMGGTPLTALNIVCFPCKNLGVEILKEILRGGAEKVLEGGGLLVGGHSINDEEPKYGLAVTGIAHPQQIWAKGGAIPGQLLVLTKPLGSGVITTALKGQLLQEEEAEEMMNWMATLNKGGMEAGREHNIKACTDITGFGLLGHAMEMAEASKLTFSFNAASIPLVFPALELAEKGILPGGALANRRHLQEKICFAGIDADSPLVDLLFDPQTSGGLLMVVPQENCSSLLESLKSRGFDRAAVVGEVTERQDYPLKVYNE